MKGSGLWSRSSGGEAPNYLLSRLLKTIMVCDEERRRRRRQIEIRDTNESESPAGRRTRRPRITSACRKLLLHRCSSPGRTTLYRNPTPRAVIEQHRHHTTGGTPNRNHRRDRRPPRRPRCHRRPSTPPRRTTPTPHDSNKLYALTGQYQKRKSLAG